MKIVTWNIGGGFISSGQEGEFDLENIQYFADELKSIAPDIVCLQETHVSENNNQAKIIAEALNLNYFRTESIADSHLKGGEKLSISIISKYPIVRSKFNKLTNPNLEFIWRGEKAFSHDKGFLETKIDYNGIPIKILSGHMVPFRKFKRDFLDEEFAEIRKQIKNIIVHERIPEVICADMNFGGDIYELLPAIVDQGFNSIFEGKKTTPSGRKYDRVIISSEWEYISSRIVKGKADHYLCFADIKLK